MPALDRLLLSMEFKVDLVRRRLDEEFEGYPIELGDYEHTTLYSREHVENNPFIVDDILTLGITIMRNTSRYNYRDIVLYSISIIWNLAILGYEVTFQGIPVPYVPVGLYRGILRVQDTFTIQTKISQTQRDLPDPHQLPTSHGCVSS